MSYSTQHTSGCRYIYIYFFTRPSFFILNIVALLHWIPTGVNVISYELRYSWIIKLQIPVEDSGRGAGDEGKKSEPMLSKLPSSSRLFDFAWSVANQASNVKSSSLLNQKRALYKTNRLIKQAFIWNLCVMRTKWTIISTFFYSSHASKYKKSHRQNPD